MPKLWMTFCAERLALFTIGIVVLVVSVPALGSESAAAVRLPDGRVLATGGYGWWSRALLVTSSPEQPMPSVVEARAMTTARAGHTATLLRNGKVLLTGGFDRSELLRSTELFDPATDTFAPAANMVFPRVFHHAVALADGRVLLVGGHDDDSYSTRPAGDAEIYDPATGKFTLLEVKTTAAWGQVAVGLGDGRVLIAGGDRRTRNAEYCFPTADAVLFDSVSGTVTPTGSMVRPRCYGIAAPLADGGAVIVGGWLRDDHSMGSSIEIYDAASGTFREIFREIPAEATPRSWGATATLLLNGRVLIAGGWEETSAWEATASIEMFEPKSDTLRAAGNLVQRRASHAAVLLGDGRVLFVGGSSLAGDAGFEIFDPNIRRRRSVRR